MSLQFARAACGLLILLGIGQVLFAQENDKSAIIAIRVTLTAAPQAKPELKITDPPAGSIVNPGQALTVKVSSPTSALFSEVALIGEEQIRLEVLAEFPDRTKDAFTLSTYRATESSHISFSSANTDVATVDSSGQVTAVAPGVGEIRVKYTLGKHKLSIGIPVGMHNPDEETSLSKFSFSIAPGFQKIEPGGSASFKVSVSSYTKFLNEIEFSAHGLPEGATASFAPVSVHATESATLTISTLASTTLDTYTIFITGKSGKLNPTASVLLIVTTDDKK